MAWSDEPTYAQINTIFQCLNWEVRELSTEEARAAAKWLEKSGTRRDVSNEIGRLKKLRDEQPITRQLFC